MKAAYLKPIVVKSFNHGLKQTRAGSFKGQAVSIYPGLYDVL